MHKNNPNISIKSCELPKQSALIDDIATANYYDSFKLVEVSNKLELLDIYLLMVNNTPAWINQLLSLRNKLVKLFGLKDVGNLGGLKQADYLDKDNLIGRKLDIFEISKFSQNEMILVLNDKHLDIKMSVLKYSNDSTQNNIVVISTVVNFNNLSGKLYMAAIKPFHCIIIKRLLRNVVNITH